jgi:hypothetical protein
MAYISPTPDAVLRGGGWLQQPDHGITFINSAYVATTSDKTILAVVATSYTLTLPLARNTPPGFELFVKKIDSASATLTIAASDSDQIDGALTYAAITTQWYGLKLLSDGVANWYIVNTVTT